MDTALSALGSWGPARAKSVCSLHSHACPEPLLLHPLGIPMGPVLAAAERATALASGVPNRGQDGVLLGGERVMRAAGSS